MLILITTALFILKQISQTVKKAGFPLVRKPALSFLNRLKLAIYVGTEGE